MIPPKAFIFSMMLVCGNGDGMTECNGVRSFTATKNGKNYEEIVDLISYDHASRSFNLRSTS
jgi:hypothetical protein